ncbi:MAG TPA: hypothetical protein PKD91_08340, partial [Bacteroidia bacterium]|nr:hypothetical protein [Bacteroidia bacterium]
MRKLIVLFYLSMWISHAKGQQDSITTRDTIEFTYLLKNSIIPEFQELLSVIAIEGTLQNEVEQIIENRVKRPGEKRLFYDEKVIVDSDLIPGSETNTSFRGEMTVEQYLLNFHTSYAKSEDPGISMVVLEISPLKKKDYLFYNVLFRC